MVNTLKKNFIKSPLCRLFCIHHAGGTAALFKNFPPFLYDLGIEVVPIQLFGREELSEKPFFQYFEDAVNYISKKIEDASEVPFGVLGHSLGALLAYESVKNLEIKNKTCHLLIISACAAPRSQKGNQLTGELLSDHQLIEKLKENNLFPLNDENEIHDMFLERFRADFALFNNYVYEPSTHPLVTPILALGGENDQIVSADDLKEWYTETINHFEVLFFPGSHFYIQSSVSSICKKIKNCLFDPVWQT